MMPIDYRPYTRWAEGFAKFHKYCLEAAVSYRLFYQEGGDEMEIEIVGSPGETFYVKRAPSFELFVEYYEEEMKKRSAERVKFK